MKKRKIQSVQRYWLAFLISTLIFLVVIFISYQISYFQSNLIRGEQEDTAYTLFEEKSAYSFFGEDICSKEIYSQLSRSLTNQAKSMAGLEDKLGKEDKRVLERKKFYTLLLVEHLDFIEEYNQKCNGNATTILFFYSNIGETKYSSADAGKILDVVRSRNQGVLVYSFDYDLDSVIIDKLKKKYEIENDNTPLIIINGFEKIYWEFNLDDVESKIRA